MNFDSWVKKEKPFATMIGMGGGATSLINTSGGGGSGIIASGGIVGEYVDGAGDAYKCHVFTSSGILSITAVNGDGEIEYLCVAGGGGAGSITGSGGGGGGFRTNMAGNPLSANNPIVVTANPIAITVGHGGKAGSVDPYGGGWSLGLNGGPSIFAHPTSPITASGGGAGKGYDTSPTAAANAGGSGGGGNGGGPGGPEGAGNTPPVSPVQGYAGGPGGSGQGTGGGGGAGGQGSTGSPTARGGVGGLGQPLTIEGDIYTTPGDGASNVAKNSSYAPGGSGGSAFNYSSSTPTISNPVNGGEAGYGPTSESWNSRHGAPGVAGFGGGGGGCGQNGEGAPGGSGVVVVRYKTGSMTATAKATGGIVNFYPGSPLSPTGATIHIFRAAGTFTMPGSFNETIEWWMIGGGGSGGGNIGGGGGSGQMKTGTGSFSGPATSLVFVGRGGRVCGPSPENGTYYQRAGGPSGINLPGSPTPLGIPYAWQTGGGGGGGGHNQNPKNNGESGSTMGGPTYRGSGGGGCGGPGNGSGGTGGPSGNPNPTTTWGSNPGGSGSPNDDGGGGGGAGGSAGTPAGGTGVQLPATFRNPEMIGTPNTSYGAPGGAGGGGGLGYPGPGGGWFWFGGGGNGGQYPTGYGSWGGGAAGAWYGAKPIMMSTGYAGGGNSTGPDNTKSPPGTNPALGDGGAGGVNSGGGGGGTCKCGPSFPSPDDPDGGYYYGGMGGTGIVLVAYPQ